MRGFRASSQSVIWTKFEKCMVSAGFRWMRRYERFKLNMTHPVLHVDDVAALLE